MIGDIHYLNSGDWVESLTAIVEHHDGRLELITYREFVARFPVPQPSAVPAEEIEEPLHTPVLA
jgi:hypothetical protein